MKKKITFWCGYGKKGQNIEKENIIIVKKKSFLLTIFEIIGKIFKLIICIILFILLTVGATVIINSQTRLFLMEIFKNMF